MYLIPQLESWMLMRRSQFRSGAKLEERNSRRALFSYDSYTDVAHDEQQKERVHHNHVLLEIEVCPK